MSRLLCNCCLICKSWCGCPDSEDGRNEVRGASSPYPPLDMQISPLPKDMGLGVSNAMATKMTSSGRKDGRNEESEALSPYPPPKDPKQISPLPKDTKEERSWETAEDPSKKKEPSGTNKHPELKELFTRLNLTGRDNSKLSTSDVLEIDVRSCQPQGPKLEGEIAQTFLNLLFMMDYRARYIPIKEENNESSLKNVKHRQNKDGDVFASLFSKKDMDNEGAKKQSQIHPMDVQMAVFHSADPFLRQSLLTKLSMCQYALPLLVPNAFTSEIEFPLWAFRQVWKSWKSTDASGTVTVHNEPMYGVETPMVSVFRLGPVSTSKSQLINSLINERHSTFYHRHCPGSSRTRLLMDGVVEIAWYCPSGKDTDHFPECVAICNLHGDGEACKMQQTVLSEMASVNVAFLPSLSKTDTSMATVEELFSSPTPLIVLLTEDDSLLEEVSKGKFKMGLRGRNQSEIVRELKKAINECLSLRRLENLKNPRLENLTQQSGIKVDEDDGDCRKGKEVALQIKDLLEAKTLSGVKETFLPCQGKLWHDWCQKNKERYRLHGNLEEQKSQIENDMMSLRCKQQKAGRSDLMKLFLDTVDSLPSLSRTYFLKWNSILMDSCTSDELVKLHHKYNEKWSKVLVLKKKHDNSNQLEKERTELEKISDQLNAATFGLEHILREMGQIYEADVAVSGGRDQSNLPAKAAELMISGRPLELMDGDAGHVPLIWITAVLDEVIKKIEDKRIFVLSILGIQSTGKSTMLNAMFGLQFAVSAGRCTRGAFMQLISVTGEIKSQFDYILVVDTEGLRALELAGKDTVHHDNELATFVIGLGHMTLINIFGENPSEMQDILQIAVQAFLRMKKVKLSPSCVFVHQNVGDISAGEKNTEGKRRLQDKLDEMTKLAAKEEDCDAKCFSDVIAFDIQKDVKYFAQLWEGSPPMAPPNPCYSESVQDLKETILSKASESKGMTLSEFKTTISDLWNALLNENFVFSFKNTIEIAVYKKLETEYFNWTWSLRNAMLRIENKQHNKIQSGNLAPIKKSFLLEEMRPTYEEVEKTMAQYFGEQTDKEMLVQWKGRFEIKISQVHSDLLKETEKKLNDLIHQKGSRKKVDEKKAGYEKSLIEKSRELALRLKHQHKGEDDLKKEFDEMWKGLLLEIPTDSPPVEDCDIWEDVMSMLSEGVYERRALTDRLEKADYKNITSRGIYSTYVMTGVPECHQSEQAKKVPLEALWKKLKGLFKTDGLTADQQESIQHLTQSIHEQVRKIIEECSVQTMGYNKTHIQKIAASVRQSVRDYEQVMKQGGFAFSKMFTDDLLLFVCQDASKKISELHKKFQKDNDVCIYLEDQRSQYFMVFKVFFQGSQSHAVLGDLICSKLEVSIKEAVYDQTAFDLAGEMRSDSPAFNGNRLNLEKHILLSLAEEENFDRFMKYIHNPKEHLKSFIIEQVKKYMATVKSPRLILKIQRNLQYKTDCAIEAAQRATEKVKTNHEHANMWLSHFSDELKDELKFDKKSGFDAFKITDDVDFLDKVVSIGLKKIVPNLKENFSRLSLLQTAQFRTRPDEILFKCFSSCCWVQCPFCKAICTNTVQNHPNDHSVPLHRPFAVNGMQFKGTTNFCVDFCTTLMASTGTFSIEDSEKIPYKEYRRAGTGYANWSIIPDNFEVHYWKWFVCRFQGDLEKYYKNNKFEGYGKIPDGWRMYTKEQVKKSLDVYMIQRI